MLVGVDVLPRVAKPAGLDIGEPFAGYSHNVGLMPLPTDRLPKARQWCRAVQRQIWATWWAAVGTDTHLTPRGMHHETEAVSVEAGLAVGAVQVLYEIFLGAYPRKMGGDASTSPFERFCHDQLDGQAASGLKLIRNGEMHANSIVVPDVQRTVGVSFEDGDKGFRIFPRWADYAQLPAEVREARREPAKGRPSGSGSLMTNQIHHTHFQDVVAGTPVVEALMDAFAFFARCDPRASFGSPPMANSSTFPWSRSASATMSVVIQTGRHERLSKRNCARIAKRNLRAAQDGCAWPTFPIRTALALLLISATPISTRHASPCSPRRPNKSFVM